MFSVIAKQRLFPKDHSFNDLCLSTVVCPLMAQNAVNEFHFFPIENFVIVEILVQIDQIE